MKVKDTIKKPYGIYPAPVAIWDTDQTYNKRGMEKYLAQLLDNGAQSIPICGDTSEDITVSMEEQREIIEHVSGFLDGQVPLVCGTGGYDTLDTIKMSESVQDHDASYVIVILLFYLNPHKKIVMQHFRGLRETLDIEIMAYNNPWFTGYELSVQEARELVDDDTTQCIRAAHDDPDRVHELKYHCRDDLTVFYEHDCIIMENLLARAGGWPLGFPAALPKQRHRLQDACSAKNMDAAIATQNSIQPYTDYSLYDKVSGVPHWQGVCKYTSQAQGLDVGLSRKPLGELDGANERRTERLLIDME